MRWPCTGIAAAACVAVCPAWLAARKGIRVLRLSAALSARPFYERLGYRMLTFEPRDDGSTWLMSKSLIQP